MANETEERSIEDIMADMRANRLALAKAQQPILSTIVDILRSDDVKGALDTLKAAGDKLSSSSTVGVQITNLCTVYANLATAVSREAVDVASSVGTTA